MDWDLTLKIFHSEAYKHKFNLAGYFFEKITFHFVDSSLNSTSILLNLL